MSGIKTFYGESEAFAVKKLRKEIPPRFKKNLFRKSKGFFVELYDNPLDKKSFIACSIDGVGSKVLIATLMNKFDTIGQDLVAMSANDLSALPSTKPFLFLNYIAAQDKILEKGITGKIMKGIVRGLQEADCNRILKSGFVLNLGKGETAFMNEVIADHNGLGFDLAGAMIGFVEKKHAKMDVRPGMDIIALKSSGVHCNGLTVARHLLLNGKFEKRKKFRGLYRGKFGLNHKMPDGKKLGMELLKPTLIYSKLIARIARKFPEVICANNTGYGMRNLCRLGSKTEFVICNPFEPRGIFEFIKNNSGLSWEKMYETFNMHHGFFILCRKNQTKKIMNLIKKSKFQGRVIGETRKGKSRVLLKAGFLKKPLVFKNY